MEGGSPKTAPGQSTFVLHHQEPISSMVIRRALANWGSVVACNPSKPGTMYIKFVPLSSDAAKQLTQVKTIFGHTVSISMHQSTSCGTVYFRECTTWSTEEIEDELGNRAKFVRRLPTRDGASSKSGRLLLEFQGSLPEFFALCGKKLPVRRHTPPPLRCAKCHVYNHHVDMCNNVERCARCGASDHTRQACVAATPCCPACKGAHEIDALNCPVWKREWDIKKLRLSQGVTSAEARKIVKPGQSQQAPKKSGGVVMIPAPPPTTNAWPALVQRKARAPVPPPAMAVAVESASEPVTQPPPQNNDAILKLFEKQNEMIENQNQMFQAIQAQNTQILNQNAQIIALLTTFLSREKPLPAAVTAASPLESSTAAPVAQPSSKRTRSPPSSSVGSPATPSETSASHLVVPGKKARSYNLRKTSAGSPTASTSRDGDAEVA